MRCLNILAFHKNFFGLLNFDGSSKDDLRLAYLKNDVILSYFSENSDQNLKIKSKILIKIAQIV